MVARARMLLNALTVVLVLVGAWFWLKEPVVPSVILPPADVKSTSQPKSIMPASADAGAIVTSNIFSASRTPPTARYTPHGAGEEAATTIAEVPNAFGAPSASPPRVYGTMTGTNGATALMQTDSAGSASRTYREGDRVGPFRIEKILPSSVIVRGPDGRVELKVEQHEDRR